MDRWWLAIVLFGLLSLPAVAHQPRPHAEADDGQPKRVDFLELDSVLDSIAEKSVVETRRGKRFIVRLRDGTRYETRGIAIKSDAGWQIHTAEGMHFVQLPTSHPLSTYKHTLGW
jgi:hypothetical protein